MDPLSLIEQTFGPLAGKRLLDIGCGNGDLVRALNARGAMASGVDPAAPVRPSLQSAPAENLPFAPGSFDGAVFINSLHHVPVAHLDNALRESARVVGPGNTVLVIEPLAAGSFFSALRIIEDETGIRAAAQSAIQRAITSGVYRLAAQHDYIRRDQFPDLDQFLARVLAADATRQSIIGQNRASIAAAFTAAATRTELGTYVLEQPIRAHVLTAN